MQTYLAGEIALRVIIAVAVAAAKIRKEVEGVKVALKA